MVNLKVASGANIGSELLQWVEVSTWSLLGPDYKKILRLSYGVIITYDNRKSNLR